MSAAANLEEAKFIAGRQRRDASSLSQEAAHVAAAVTETSVHTTPSSVTADGL